MSEESIHNQSDIAKLRTGKPMTGSSVERAIHLSKRKHKEAFCLMQYKDEVTGETEILWNSRDGVTPFVITSKRGNAARHENWQQDVCIPDFKPAPGMRIFVDATRENLKQSAVNYVNEYWEGGNYPMRGNLAKTKEEAIEKILDGWLEQEGQPHITEVI